MSSKKQVTEGLSTMSRGALRVLGLIKIYSLLKPYLDDTKRNTVGGLRQIKEGFLHIFGKTDRQQHERWLDALVSTEFAPEHRKRAYRQYYDTLHSHYWNEIHLSNFGDAPYHKQIATPFSPVEMVHLSAQILKNLSIANLVGIQPMETPASHAHYLTYKCVEVETVTEDTQPGSGSSLDAVPEAFTALMNPKIGQRLTLEYCKAVVEANTRMLQTKWHPEVIPNLNGVHHPDLQDEVRRLIAQEVAYEIDVEHIQQLYKLAKQESDIPSNAESFNRLLRLRASKAANEIARETRRGAGNWMIVSARARTALDEVGAITPATENSQYTNGALEHIGYMNASIRVYTPISTFVPPADILIGYKGGSDEIDTGYIFSPYIPVSMCGASVDADTFIPQIRMRTRYGTTALPNVTSYYRSFNITDPIEAASEN